MKLKGVIVDDEDFNIDILQELLESHAKDFVQIVGTANTADGAVDLINELKPEVLFLDVQLDIGTSFDVLKNIDEYPYFTVFVTAYDEYILDSFKFNAINYILKPISAQDVKESMELLKRRANNRNYTIFSQLDKLIASIEKPDSNNFVEVLGIPEVGSTLFVKYDDILYCKSDGRYTEIHLSSGIVHTSAKNLGKYELMLPKGIFYRLHKSYIVNLSAIKQINRKDGFHCVIENGIRIPIASRRAEELYRLLRIN